VDILSAMYGAVATWRRRWYAGRPSRVRRLSRPVISVGNLRVGGTGKTPIVAHLAALLLANGERPAILSRGYGRTGGTRGVTVVSTPDAVLADVASAGDEPLMLARALPGVSVLVSPSRYAAGVRAEHDFGATVHLLDDGFQHVQLARDVDLLLVGDDDLHDRVLPSGRLREPLVNARVAHAALVTTDHPDRAATVAHQLGLATSFRVVRQLQPLVRCSGSRAASSVSGTGSIDAPPRRVFAFAGVARPERLFRDLENAGYTLAGRHAFGDHHVYSQADVEHIAQSVRATGAAFAVTTAKDAVRLEALDTSAVEIAIAPLVAVIEPQDAFTSWLMTHLTRARRSQASAPQVRRG
jgi:tetraacyldisaccharide 4'-kinase